MKVSEDGRTSVQIGLDFVLYASFFVLVGGLFVRQIRSEFLAVVPLLVGAFVSIFVLAMRVIKSLIQNN